jgi:hypothetical protein
VIRARVVTRYHQGLNTTLALAFHPFCDAQRRNIRSQALRHVLQTANVRLIGFHIGNVVALTRSLQLSVYGRSHWCRTTLSLNAKAVASDRSLLAWQMVIVPA